MNENPDLWRDQLKRENAQAEGLDIRGQVISRPIGILMGHIATMARFTNAQLCGGRGSTAGRACCQTEAGPQGEFLPKKMTIRIFVQLYRWFRGHVSDGKPNRIFAARKSLPPAPAGT